MSPRAVLVILIVLAAAVRFGWPSTPPGMHIDEASNAWNARCLGATLLDEHRQMLPLLYTRAFNDNRSPMYLYLAAPFETLAGPTAVDVPAKLSGVAAVALLWLFVRRLAGDRAAWVAGLAWALDPTFAQYTRFGHESSITPMLVLASLCLWQKAGLLWAPNGRPPPKRPVAWATLAGAFSGFACYGYAAVRLYLPALLLASLVFGRHRPRVEGNTPSPTRDRWLAAAVGFALLFGPLAYAHLTDPAINERGRQTWTWDPGDGPVIAAGKVMLRYVQHFSPRFLFVTGTTDDTLSTLAPPRPFGALPWGWGPVVVTGGMVAALRCRTSRLARLTIVSLLVYPAGDVLNALGPPNVLRTLCGWWCFTLPIVVLIDAVADVGRRWMNAARLGTATVATVAVPNLVALLGWWGNDPAQQWQRGADFQEACRLIAPTLDDYDVVAFTVRDTPFDYAQVLCFLNYPPEKYFSEPLARGTVIDTKRTSPDLLVRTGRLVFLHAVPQIDGILQDVFSEGFHGKSLWVLRPSEPWPPGDVRLLHTVRLSDGTPSLVVLEHRESVPSPAYSRGREPGD